MVGHHAVGEKFDPGKRRDPLQQLDEARTLLRIQEEGPTCDPTDQVINTIWQVLAKFSHAAYYIIISANRITATVSQGSDPGGPNAAMSSASIGFFMSSVLLT